MYSRSLRNATNILDFTVPSGTRSAAAISSYRSPWYTLITTTLRSFSGSRPRAASTSMRPATAPTPLSRASADSAAISSMASSRRDARRQRSIHAWRAIV